MQKLQKVYKNSVQCNFFLTSTSFKYPSPKEMISQQITFIVTFCFVKQVNQSMWFFFWIMMFSTIGQFKVKMWLCRFPFFSFSFKCWICNLPHDLCHWCTCRPSAAEAHLFYSTNCTILYKIQSFILYTSQRACFMIQSFLINVVFLYKCLIMVFHLNQLQPHTLLSAPKGRFTLHHMCQYPHSLPFPFVTILPEHELEHERQQTGKNISNKKYISFC